MLEQGAKYNVTAKIKNKRAQGAFGVKLFQTSSNLLPHLIIFLIIRLKGIMKKARDYISRRYFNIIVKLDK